VSPAAAAAAGAGAQIPLLPAHDKLVKAQHDDLAARLQLHPPDNLPSAAFFSILNSQQVSCAQLAELHAMVQVLRLW
jgi:hypothetical protein